MAKKLFSLIAAMEDAEASAPPPAATEPDEAVSKEQTEKLGEGWKEALMGLVENGPMAEEDLPGKESLKSLAEAGCLTRVFVSDGTFKYGVTEFGTKLYCQVVGEKDLQAAMAKRKEWLSKDADQAEQAAELAETKAEDEAKDAENTAEKAEELNQIEEQAEQGEVATEAHRSVALEGFVSKMLGKILGNKKEETKAPEVSLWKWMSDTIDMKNAASQLKPGFYVEYGTHTFTGKKATYFKRGGKPVQDLIAEYRKDAQRLKSIYNRYKDDLKKNNALLKEFSKACDKATDGNDLNRIVLSFKGKSVINIAAKFSADNSDWMGPLTSDFLNKRGEFPHDVQDSTTKNESSVDFTMTEEMFKKLLVAADEATENAWQFDDIKEKFDFGIDATDPPFRAWYEDMDDEAFEIANQFFMEAAIDCYSYYLLSQLNDRYSEIQNGLWSIIRAFVKKGEVAQEDISEQEPVVAQEGIVDSLKKLLGLSGNKISMKDVKTGEAINKLKATYLNDEWLEAQPFKDKQVVIRKGYYTFVNDSADFGAGVMMSEMDKFVKVAKEKFAYAMKELTPYEQAITSGTIVEKSEEYSFRLDDEEFYFVIPYINHPKEVGKQFRSLDKEQAKKAAELIVRLLQEPGPDVKGMLKLRSDFYRKWGMESTGLLDKLNTLVDKYPDNDDLERFFSDLHQAISEFEADLPGDYLDDCFALERAVFVTDLANYLDQSAK